MIFRLLSIIAIVLAIGCQTGQPTSSSSDRAVSSSQPIVERVSANRISGSLKAADKNKNSSGTYHVAITNDNRVVGSVTIDGQTATVTGTGDIYNLDLVFTFPDKTWKAEAKNDISPFNPSESKGKLTVTLPDQTQIVFHLYVNDVRSTTIEIGPALSGLHFLTLL